MEINIRAINIGDAKDVNVIRTMDGVRETILGVTSERITSAEDFINNLGPNDHHYVAEIEENGKKKVIGTCGLSIYASSRLRHSAKIGIMIHKDYQGLGVGRKLIETILELADNWLMLVRVELTVFEDNLKAQSLYKSVGFEIEGTMRNSAIRNGKYENEYLMSRINKKLIP